MALRLVLFVFLLVHTPLYIHGCYLWGTDSGTCTEDSLNPIWREEFMPFCAEKINFPVCIPKHKTLPPSREFPEGRWSEHTVANKDKWVANSYIKFRQERMDLENNKTLRRKNQNEYGDIGKIKRRFYKRADCQNAFKNMFCWLNFPRCDPNRDLTLPTCRSTCENFFKACVYERGLWRCGRSKYFNGYEPETPTIGLDGNATYLRDYFPGQPFRENLYTNGGSELPVCTPAVLGRSSSHAPSVFTFAWTILLVFALFGVLFSF